MIATGFDNGGGRYEPEKPAEAASAAEERMPKPLDYEAEQAAKEQEDDDPFADIFKIFNRDGR